MVSTQNLRASVRATSIVLASSNAGKVAELGALLAPFHLAVYPLARFTSQSPEETGTTFHENALLKARFAAAAAGLPAIADDSGLEVDALDGAPGVYSARYAGADATDTANNEKLLAALATVADERRSARFRCVLAYVRSAEDTQPILAEGVWEGTILRAARGTAGFGYDPLFVPLGSRQSSAELTRQEKNRLSHRAQALQTLISRLKERGELSA